MTLRQRVGLGAVALCLVIVTVILGAAQSTGTPQVVGVFICPPGYSAQHCHDLVAKIGQARVQARGRAGGNGVAIVIPLDKFQSGN